MRGVRPSMLACSVLAALLAQSIACRPDRAPPPAASAAPAVSSTAPPAASSGAPDAAPAITHEPGTVPPPPSARRVAPPPDAAAAPLPVFARLPAAKSRKSTDKLSYQVGFPGKGALVAVSSPGRLDVVDATTGAGYSITGAAGEGSPSYVLSPDESLLALSEGDGRVTLWDTAKGAIRYMWTGGGPYTLFSADGKRIAMVADTQVWVRDTATGKDIMHATTEMPAFGLAFGAGGKELVLTENNVQVEVYSVETGAKLPGGGDVQTGATFGVAVSPDGRWAAGSAPDGHGLQVFDVHAWGPRTLVVISSCKEHVGPVFSPNGRFVYAYGGRLWVKGFEVGSFKPYASYHAPEGREVESAAADLSRVVVTRGEGRGAVVVNVSTGAETPLERAFERDASYVLSEDGALVAGTSGALVRVGSAKTGRITYEQAP